MDLSRLKPEEQQELAALLHAAAVKRAQSSLIEFTQYTFPQYTPGWFHREVAAELDRFLADVEAKKSPRLILCAPPQHGKSELVSRRFPAYALGRNPDLRIIATSYAATLAYQMSSDVRQLMDSEPYHEVFPATMIPGQFVKGAGAKNTDELFHVVGRRGRYRAAGVGQGITGQSAEIGIIDDPIKDHVEAFSEATRERVWNWYLSTFLTRIQEGGGVIVMATRWHEDDLIGRLLKTEPDKWRVVVFPAIAEEDEKHRKAREPLSVERFSLRTLLEVKAKNAYIWNALYQQRPSSPKGNIFQREWWRFFEKPPQFRMIVQSWDTAYTTKKANDPSCCETWGVTDTGYYLVDLWMDRLAFPDLKKAAVMLADTWKPSAIYVEAKASGISLVQELGADTALPLILCNVDADKVARAHAVSPLMEAGRVWLPAKQTADWVDGFIERQAAFPNGPHDDDTDAMTQALQELRQRSGGLWGFYEEAAAALQAKTA